MKLQLTQELRDVTLRNAGCAGNPSCSPSICFEASDFRKQGLEPGDAWRWLTAIPGLDIALEQQFEFGLLSFTCKPYVASEQQMVTAPKYLDAIGGLARWQGIATSRKLDAANSETALRLRNNGFISITDRKPAQGYAVLFQTENQITRTLAIEKSAQVASYPSSITVGGF